MKSNSLVNPRIAAFTVCGMALAFSVFAPRARADEWDKRTILNVRQTIQVTDKVLPPGQYVLKLLDSQSDRDIVQIYNGNETKYIGTVLAIPAYRMDPTGRTEFTFWETPPGMAKALRTWYYPGDNYGTEFPYPKQLASLETSSASVSVSKTANAEPATPAPPPAVAPPAQPNPPAANSNPPVANNEETQPNEMNEQPQQTPAQPTPAQSDNNNSSANRSTELPKTASPFPEIGAIGLLSLLGFAGLRLRQSVRH